MLLLPPTRKVQLIGTQFVNLKILDDLNLETYMFSIKSLYLSLHGACLMIIKLY